MTTKQGQTVHAAKDQLIDGLVADQVSSYAGDGDCFKVHGSLANVFRRGIGGFDNMTLQELVQSARDAGVAHKQSAAIKVLQAAAMEVESTKAVKVVVGAYGTSDNGDAPSYAAFEVTQALLDKLAKLVKVCGEHVLTEARVTGYPNWGPGDIEDELRLQNGEMVVLPGGSFWFTDYPKYGDYRIESRGADIAAIQVAFDSATDGEVVFLTDDQEVREQYAEDSEVAEDDGLPVEQG